MDVKLGNKTTHLILHRLAARLHEQSILYPKSLTLSLSSQISSWLHDTLCPCFDRLGNLILERIELSYIYKNKNYTN
jgi:hypothetical protein